MLQTPSLRCAGDAAQKAAAAASATVLILLAAAAANAHRADDLAIALQRDPTGEDHHTAVIRAVDAEELAPGCAFSARSLVAGSNARAVNALLIEMSTLPIQAPSILTWAMRSPPASTTATFDGYGATLFMFGPPELSFDDDVVSCRHEIRGGLLTL